MGGHTTIHDYYQEDRDEETLSLCDLPLSDEDHQINNNNKNVETTNMASQTRRSSSEPLEFFEFLSDNSSEYMCAAEDIIFCGKLVPFKEPYSHPIQNPVENKRRLSPVRRRCESLSELRSSINRSNSAKARGLMRNSRSLDYRKLERLSASQKPSSGSEIDRNPSVRSVDKAGDSMALLKKAAAKPRWYQLMFGVVKPPAGMELRDIKSRQIRLNPPITMFPTPVDAGGNKVPANGSLNKSSCGLLLKVLSCKDPTSVAVTASFCMPQV